MSRNLIKYVITTAVLSVCLAGCGTDSLQQEMLSAQASNTSIKISVDGETGTANRADLTWGELDQLTTYESIRDTWDDKLLIVKFDNNSKNGVLYIDTDGNWSGNNTLYNAFQNKVFVENYWTNGKIKSTLSEAAMNVFSDISNETTGLYASVNAYYNIFPTNSDKTSGLTDYISRAEAMSAIYRGDTQVVYTDENTEFAAAVGESQYNMYAYNMADYSYLDYKNGSLCYDTYNSAITRAEALYMIVQRYWQDEYNNITVQDDVFSDCTNAGDIAAELGIKDGYAWQAYELEYCLLTQCGCPEDLYKALIVANNHGLISSESKWDQPMMGGTLLGYMIYAYESIYETNGFSVNAKMGENTGASLLATTEEAEPTITEETIGSVVVSQIKDVTDIDDLLKTYGDEIDMTDEELAEAQEIADQWTFEKADKWMEVAYCSWLNVRTGPSTDYKILSSVPAGTKCHIVAVCKENGWYRIIANKKIVYQCGVYFQDFEGSENYSVESTSNTDN